MARLFDPLTLRGLTLRNRVVLSPMCQYSAGEDGRATDWHLVHLGGRAVGGAGLVLTEDTAVLPEGRITRGDLGLWDDAQVAPLRRIADFVHAQGAAFGVQLGYAGRKGSTTIPWQGGHPRGEGRSLIPVEGAWTTLAPSALAFGANRAHVPSAMTGEDIARVQAGFAEAARRADAAGCDLVELHAAWGYIFHQFYSPLANRRTDSYGGGFEGRIRFMLETVRAVRRVWPGHKPLAARIALTDWIEGGWSLDDAVRLAVRLSDEGVDLIDGISSAVVPGGASPFTPLMHVPMVARLKAKAGVAVAANFGIETPEQAEGIVARGDADAVVLGRAMLKNPHWPRHAAEALKDDRLLYPAPYEHWLSGRVPEGTATEAPGREAA